MVLTLTKITIIIIRTTIKSTIALKLHAFNLIVNITMGINPVQTITKDQRSNEFWVTSNMDLARVAAV